MTFLSTLRTWWKQIWCEHEKERIISWRHHEYLLQSAILELEIKHIQEKQEMLQENLQAVQEIKASYLKEQSLI